MGAEHVSVSCWHLCWEVWGVICVWLLEFGLSIEWIWVANMAWHVFRGSRLNERGIKMSWVAVVKSNKKQHPAICLQGSYIPFTIYGTFFLMAFINPVLLNFPMSLPLWPEWTCMEVVYRQWNKVSLSPAWTRLELLMQPLKHCLMMLLTLMVAVKWTLQI